MKHKKLLLLFLVLIVALVPVSVVYGAEPSGQVNGFYCQAIGENYIFDYQLAKIVRYVILIIQVIVPIILVIFGLVDMVKAMMAQKEDEIKKGQQTFIKRLISAILVFFVIAIVKLVISLVASKQTGTIMDCVDCFIGGVDYNTKVC